MPGVVRSWPPRVSALVRGMLEETARVTTVALLVVSALSAAALTTSMLVLHSARAEDDGGRPVPPGVVAVAPVPELVLPVDDHDAGDGTDRLPLTGAPALPEAVLQALAALPGAPEVVPDRHLEVLAAPVLPGGPGGGARTALSTWPAAEMAGSGLVDGRPPTTRDTAVVGRAAAEQLGVDVGQEVQVVTSTGAAARVRVSGIGDDAGSAGLDQILVSPAGMAAVAGPHPPVGAARAWVHAGADGGVVLRDVRKALLRIEAAAPVPIVAVGPGAALPARQDPAADSLVGLAVIVSTVIGAVSAFVLCGTSSFAVARRSRSLALMRLTGATPGQVRTHLLRESALLGLVASAVGVGCGYLLAAPVLAGLVHADLAGPGTSLRPALWPAVIAGVAGWAAPVLAVLVAGRRAAALLPAHALREAEAPTRRPGPVRRAAGLVLVAAAAALAVGVGQVRAEQAANIALTLAFCLVAAAALLGPDLSRGTSALLAGPLGRVSASGYVAARSLRREPFRAAALSQPVLLGVALAGVLLGTGGMVDASAAQQALIRGAPAYVVSPAGVPTSVADAVRDVPGVRAAVHVQPSRVVVRRPSPTGLRELAAAALDGSPGTAFRLSTVAGDPAHLGPGRSVLSRSAAAETGLWTGDELTTYGPDGRPSTTRVAAVVDGTDGFADVVLDVSDLLGVQPSTGAAPSYLAVVAPAPVVRDVLPAAVTTAAAQVPGWPEVTVQDRGQWVAGHRARALQDVRGVYVLVAAVLALSATALLVTGSIDLASRRRELAQLRASGATAAQARRSLSIEGAAAAAVGGATGAAVTIVSSTMLSRALPGHPAPDVGLTLQLSVVCVLVGAALFAVLVRSSTPGNAAHADVP